MGNEIRPKSTDISSNRLIGWLEELIWELHSAKMSICFAEEMNVEPREGEELPAPWPRVMTIHYIHASLVLSRILAPQRRPDPLSLPTFIGEITEMKPAKLAGDLGCDGGIACTPERATKIQEVALKVKQEIEKCTYTQDLMVLRDKSLAHLTEQSRKGAPGTTLDYRTVLNVEEQLGKWLHKLYSEITNADFFMRRLMEGFVAYEMKLIGRGMEYSKAIEDARSLPFDYSKEPMESWPPQKTVKLLERYIKAYGLLPTLD